jgi:hypothetical protein
MRNNEPSILDFKTEQDVNFAIANSFMYVFNINRYKDHINILHWCAETEVNADLHTSTTKTIHSDSEYVEEYIPDRILNSRDPIGYLSYSLIDDRIALLALSWWTMFISTKDGARMVYYPYTSQIKDSENLKIYPSRNAWFKDTMISKYYEDLGVDLKKVPDIITIEKNEIGALDYNFFTIVPFLQTEGFKFVLWLYNYIKLNKGLVPYSPIDEYVSSINDIPIYRNGNVVDLNSKSPLGKFSASNELKQIDSATGISQTGFNRNSHSCGLIINTPENIEDLLFTNENIKIRFSKKFIDFTPNTDKNTDKLTTENSKIKDIVQYNSRIIDEASQISSFFTKLDLQIPKNTVSVRGVNEIEPVLINNSRNSTFINENDLRK